MKKLEPDKWQQSWKEEKNAKKRRHILVAALLLIFFVIFVTVQFIGNYSFEVTHYSLNSNKLEIPIRIAALSDLHSKEYGEENEKLVETIKNEHPDMIVMLGDMVNKDDADISVIRTLCRQLKEIAPVYYSMGNHEGHYDDHPYRFHRHKQNFERGWRSCAI